MSGLTAPFTLVIDDYHAVTNAEFDIALAELLDFSPHLSLVVIGRRVTLLDRPIVTGRTPTTVIGPRDLAVPPEEALALAAKHGLAESDRLRAAIEQSAGWPLAIRAVLEAPLDDVPVDPFTGLNRFALDHLELVGSPARHMLLAASQLDAITLDQAAEFCETDMARMRAGMHTLIEYGVLTAIAGPDTTEFRCHPAVLPYLAARARRSFSSEQRSELYIGRAERIVGTAPFTAFRLYCAAEAYSEAEVVLALHFTTIIDEVDETSRILRSLTDATLETYPTFAAARLLLAMPDPTVPPATLNLLIAVWQRGVERAYSEGSARSEELELPRLAQAMVLERLLGKMEEAGAHARELEARLKAAESEEDPIEVTGQRPSDGPNATLLHGSLPTYYREIASTALMVGDFAQARRNWAQLRMHAERMIVAPWHGFPHASTRTVTDVESGQRWLLAALYEQAYTEVLDGDIRRCAELLTEADTFARETGTAAPGLSWVAGEVGRAHLSYELADEALLEQALTTLAPTKDRIEQWSLLLIAQAEAERRRRGVSWAISQLQANLVSLDESRRRNDAWQGYLDSYLALLYTVLGDFVSASKILDGLDQSLALVRVERARLALFAGDDVQALLIAQAIGDSGATKRQRLERCLISATAAWACDKPQESALALQNAADLMERYYLPSALWGVPFALLREAAVAARDAGVADLVELIDAVPEEARCERYGQLTEMEQRTLEAIAVHRSANEAASALFVTQGTVKKHLASVYRKLHAKGRNDAILQAARMGLLPRGYAGEGAA
ncbi:LuxR C-terminal-related transcriptional regulator [Leucobacter soli]|uniref:HTH-type transcriptional regulator MalT n=1 Tax=Leucobacter soli TaxID=2812850 RepID=A0A916JWK3_9MICO|nr:LuxR C-terminal-related transcriptional regulator [Leucobacter soli]CAG7607476.1 HTH-type transcriptional regulator MalT [Leucobacter soli]